MKNPPPAGKQRQVINFRTQLAQLANEYERLYDENMKLRDVLEANASVTLAAASNAVYAVEPISDAELNPSCTIAPIPIDPLAEADVLPERCPCFPASDLQSAFLSPREHSHSQKPQVDGNDVGEFILEINDESTSDGPSAIDAEHTDSLTECPTPEDSGRAPDGLFPRWFDPGDIQVEEMSGCSRGVSPVGFSEGTWGSIDQCILLPFGHLRLIWDSIAFLCILLELWITPFQLIFCEYFQTPFGIELVPYIINAFFAFDILLNFNTAYIDGDEMIMQRRLIASNYVRSWFWVDLVATVPWDLLLMSLGGVMTVGKMVKAPRALKAVRYLKMVRLLKFMRTCKQANFVSAHSHKLSMLAELFKKPSLLFMFLLLFSHIHGIVYAALQPSEWLATESVHESLNRYVESFWWAFTALSSGIPPGAQHTGCASTPVIRLLDMILMFERFMVFLCASERVIMGTLYYIDEAHKTYQRQEMMKHLRENSVSMMTQLQVLSTWRETGKAQTKCKQFSELMNENLPCELKRSICAELWSAKLMSMGLIKEVAQWDSGFVKEFAQLASEEVFATTSVIFNVGDASTVAYYIDSGVLAITNSCSECRVPDFTKGMWVGESALVSTVLRRSATCTARMTTSCMAVQGAHFQQLLSNLGLTARFQDFCAKQLWRGICGRCGMLGDHFSDTCGRRGRRRSSFLFTQVSSQSRDLQQFLEEKGILWLLPMLLQIGICSLDDLEKVDIQSMQSMLSKNEDVTHEILHSTLTAAQSFQEEKSQKAHQALFHEVSRLHHLIFLSHYKVEAGTEAALMRNELESAIKQDAGHLGNNFDESVFLDSDNLVNLEDLQRRVQNTHNLVLLLTKGVLQRPWVLVEIMTARREGVRILLVNVSKPGSQFEFPDDSFFMELAAGRYLDREAVELIRRFGFSLPDVEEALRAVFQQIAVPYSPHKASSLRSAEIAAILKQCRLKSEVTESKRTSDSSSTMSCCPKDNSRKITKLAVLENVLHKSQVLLAKNKKCKGPFQSP